MNTAVTLVIVMSHKYYIANIIYMKCQTSVPLQIGLLSTIVSFVSIFIVQLNIEIMRIMRTQLKE